MFTIGSAAAAVTVGRISQRLGRRTGLALGYAAGSLGSLGVVAAAVLDNIALLFLALFVYGAGTQPASPVRRSGSGERAPPRPGGEHGAGGHHRRCRGGPESGDRDGGSGRPVGYPGVVRAVPALRRRLRPRRAGAVGAAAPGPAAAGADSGRRHRHRRPGRRRGSPCGPRGCTGADLVPGGRARGNGNGGDPAGDGRDHDDDPDPHAAPRPQRRRRRDGHRRPRRRHVPPVPALGAARRPPRTAAGRRRRGAHPARRRHHRSRGARIVGGRPRPCSRPARSRLEPRPGQRHHDHHRRSPAGHPGPHPGHGRSVYRRRRRRGRADLRDDRRGHRLHRPRRHRWRDRAEHRARPRPVGQGQDEDEPADPGERIGNRRRATVVGACGLQVAAVPSAPGRIDHRLRHDLVERADYPG
ncbi:sugar (and other) transporter family protein [Rhodococcus wratislaviensis IFP 2016]|nr:sugar (and other) transporter family protein [Rhodococcus wratislaviensis IFP 2016]